MAAVVSICGVDEAGRGPLAGPVYAAAVILVPARRIKGLKDSKLLSADQREILARIVVERALAYAIAWASVEEIDRLNILQASLLAMRRAVDALRQRPDEAIVSGDRLHAVISAASVLAKTARDAEMCRLHERFPQYGFDQHKGYGTPEHLVQLERHGPCEIHRQSFAPVRHYLSLFR